MSMRTHDLATQAVAVDIGEQRSTVDLSVVIPAFREGHRIHQNLGRLVDALNALGVGYEVIVVSDGNTDSTASEARRFGSAVKVFEYPMNVGKGFALSLGVAQSSGALVTFIDADMELDPGNIKAFMDMMQR